MIAALQDQSISIEEVATGDETSDIQFDMPTQHHAAGGVLWRVAERRDDLLICGCAFRGNLSNDAQLHAREASLS